MSKFKLQTTRFETLFAPEELWFVDVLLREKPLDLRSFNEDESTFICNFATRNGLAPLFYRSNYVDCLTTRGKLELRKEYLYNLGRNTAFQLIADEMVTILHGNGIPAILLKGSFLAPNIYADIAFRPMGDIDILVPLDKVYEAWQILNPESETTEFKDEETGHHLPTFFRRGCQIEIHKTLFPVNTKFTIPIEAIWSSALPIEGKKSFTLDPIHQIIYLMLHIYYTYRRGGLRLGWFYDVKVLLNHYKDEITLHKVQEVAQTWKVWEPVRLILMFFSVLMPDNKLFIPVVRDFNNAMEEMVMMLQKSEQQKVEYSYGVAWERLWHTKGLTNKVAFLWNIVTVESNGRKHLSFYRMWHLFRNTVRFLWRKVFSQ
jgi:hypothetical protein